MLSTAQAAIFFFDLAKVLRGLFHGLLVGFFVPLNEIYAKHESEAKRSYAFCLWPNRLLGAPLWRAREALGADRA